MQAGYKVNAKFMLDTMDNFILDVSGVGVVEAYVGLTSTVGPEEHLWTATSYGGIAQIAVKTTDMNFHIATWYYISLKARDEAQMTLSLNQQRSVEFIPNNYDFTFQLKHSESNSELVYQKFQFNSVQEQVKFHVF